MVYVYFGSQAILSNTQMEELTLGLEKSDVKFILVFKHTINRQNKNDHGMIAIGF